MVKTKAKDKRQKRTVPLFFHLSFVFCLLSLIPISFAEDITFDATVSANKVAMGTAVELTLSVHGTQDVELPQLPAIDGFESRYSGPSTQVSVINGAYSSTKAFRYILLPLKEGKFTIPSFELTYKGQIYRSQPIIVDVTPTSQTGGTSTGQPASAANLSDRIKLLVIVPRNESYVNEMLPVVIKLYFQDVPLQDISMPELKSEGIVLGDFAQPRQYDETLDGLNFRVIEFHTMLTAGKAGQYQVGPFSMNANMLYKVEGKKNPFGGNLFDEDFFSGFFNSYQKRPLTITSRSFELNVKPLPDEGRPADFSGAVGQFDFQAEVSPNEVKVGDPLTLKATITGSGSLKAVHPPQVVSDRFKVYDPQVKEESGRKSLEQVLIPTKEDVKEVPALSFNYFDPLRGQYSTVTRGPFPVKVTALAPGEEFQAARYASVTSAPLVENLGRDIIFIKDRVGALSDRQPPLLKELPFYAVLVLFLNIWGIFLGIYLYQWRLRTDEAFARRRRAPKAARAAWAIAEKAVQSGEATVFYGALEQGLRAFLSDALSLPVGDAFGPVVRERMQRQGFPDQVIVRLKALEDEIELARFASANVTSEAMTRSFNEARELTRAVEDWL